MCYLIQRFYAIVESDSGKKVNGKTKEQKKVRRKEEKKKGS